MFKLFAIIEVRSSTTNSAEHDRTRPDDIDDLRLLLLVMHDCIVRRRDLISLRRSRPTTNYDE